jgi:hypothetical protein
VQVSYFFSRHHGADLLELSLIAVANQASMELAGDAIDLSFAESTVVVPV